MTVSVKWRFAQKRKANLASHESRRDAFVTENARAEKKIVPD